MKTFRTKTYQIRTKKLSGGQRVRMAILADLHGFVYGKENQELFQAIEAAEADAVLVAGDMVVSSEPSTACLLYTSYQGTAVCPSEQWI